MRKNACKKVTLISDFGIQELRPARHRERSGEAGIGEIREGK
jgi:hypothetical protein